MEYLSGLLSDKYSSSSQKAMPGSRIDSASGGNLASMSDSFAKLRQNPVFISTMDTLQKISNKNKLSMSQVAILYALNKKFLTSVVVSVSTIKELEENMNILNQGLKLNQEDVGLYYFQNYDLYIFNLFTLKDWRVK